MPLYLFNRLRLFTNKLLAPAGFAVERVKKSNPWSRGMRATRIGRFSIQIPGTNPLSSVYVDYPDTMAELGILVGLLKKKYPNLSVIDIGANVGDTACIIKTAADVPLLCIEGDDYTFELLQQNLSQFQNISAQKLFLGEQTGNMNAAIEKGGWNTTLKPGQSTGAQTVRIVSLDDFLVGHPVANCKLLKVDTEGFDCSIIRGAKKFLQQARPVITFEFNRDNMQAIGENGLGTLALLRDLGYRPIAFHDCYGRFFTGAASLDEALVRDVLDYTDGRRTALYYFDLTVFHHDDTDIALEFIKTERARRPNALASP